MKVTLKLLLEKGLDLETATILLGLIQLHEYYNEVLDEKGLEQIVKKFKYKEKK